MIEQKQIKDELPHGAIRQIARKTGSKAYGRESLEWGK